MGEIIEGGFAGEIPEVTIFEDLAHISGKGPIVATTAPVVALGGQVLRAPEEVSRELLIAEAAEAITDAQALVRAAMLGEEVSGGQESLESAYTRQDTALALLSAEECEKAYTLWRNSLMNSDD